MKLRRLNAAGISEFRNFLKACRETPDTAVPRRILEDGTLTTMVEPAIEVDGQEFGNRRAAAEYLRDLLEPLADGAGARQLTQDVGLWSWLTLFFFDQICPPVNGKRSVKNDYYYVFEATSPHYYYRHLLFVAWRLITLSPTHNRLFLDRPLTAFDQITDEVVKRLYLTRIPCVFEVLDRLYWDESRKAPRTGIVDQKRVRPGNLRHRFPLRIRQLEMTYDLQSLNADQLLELLGDEFVFDREAALA